MKYINIFVLAFVFGVAVLVSYFLMRPAGVSKETGGQASKFSLEDAPSESLKGKVASASGEVRILDRVATESAELANTDEVQQGEGISTGGDGKVVIDFGRGGRIGVMPLSKINLIQALAANVVVEQEEGQVEYEKIGSVPMSVDALDILIDVRGRVKIVVDTGENEVRAKVEEGDLSAGFNDADSITQTLSAVKGETLIFDDIARVARVE